MAGDLRTLSKRFTRYADEIPKRANEAKKQVVRTVINDLAFVTPVDTSTAISNWQVDTTRPESPIPAHVEGERGSTYTQSARETIERAEAVLKTVQPGQPVYISNVLPYIVPLDNGSSAQEPAGFVDRAILLGRKTLDKFKFFK